MNYDTTLQSFIDGSFKSNNDNVGVSAFIGSSQDSKSIGETARLFDSAVQEGFGSRRIKDGSFNNPEMQTGVSNVMLNGAYFDNDLITLRRNELMAIYNGCWVFRKIVDIPARDMWSNGIDINCDSLVDADLTKIYTLYNRLKSRLIYATKQARIFGGAASLIMVDDGEEDLSKPLKLKNIKAGSKINFLTTDRWYGLSWSSEVVTDYRSAEFGLPKYYSFFIDGTEDSAQKVHYSRVLRFINRKSPRITEQRLQGWGISELEHVLQDLMNHENTKNAIASLLNKALLEIVKLDGMRNTMSGLSAGNPQSSQMFAAQMAALNNYRTSNKLVFMDKQDEYEKQEYSFSGLSDILTGQKDIVSGAAEMPEVILFGTNRAGLNGDKPIELKIYDNNIQGKQDEEVRPVLDKLLPVIFKCCGLEVPQDLSYEFVSMLDDTDENRQSYLTNLVNNISTLLDNELITHETALQEIQSAVKKTGFGTKISKLDEDKAKQADKLAAESPGEDENSLTEDFNEEFEQQPEEIETTVKPIKKEIKQDDYNEIKENIIRAALRDSKKRK